MVKTQTEVARWNIQLSVPRCGTDTPLLLAIIKTLSSESSEGSLRICRIYTGNHSPLPQATVDKRPFARVVFPNNPAFGIAAPGPSDPLDLREKSHLKTPRCLWSLLLLRGHLIQHGFCSLTAQSLVETPHCSSHVVSLRFLSTPLKPLCWANGNVSCSLATPWRTGLNKRIFPPWTGAFLEKQWFPLNDTLFLTNDTFFLWCGRKWLGQIGWIYLLSMFMRVEYPTQHRRQKKKKPCVADKGVWGTNSRVVRESPWMGSCQNLAMDSAHDMKWLHFQPCFSKVSTTHCSWSSYIIACKSPSSE